MEIGVKANDMQKQIVGWCLVAVPSELQNQQEKELCHWRVHGCFGNTPDYHPVTNKLVNVIGGSLMLDTYKQEEGKPAATVEASIRPEYVGSPHPDTEILYWSNPNPVKPTVEQILKGMVTLKLDKYRYGRGNSGCLWWTRVFLKNMEEAYGLIGPGWETDLKDLILRLRKVPDGYSVPYDEGWFEEGVNDYGMKKRDVDSQ